MDVEETDDYIEDEYYVYIDFEDNLTSLETDDPNLDIKIIGIDSPNPIMEVNGKTFKGTYDYSYCTNVLFEKDDNPPIRDPIYEKVPEKFYRLVGKTNKTITMSRMFLESKHDLEVDTEKNVKDNIEKETLEELKERLEINSSYEDALNLLLPPGKVPPRKIESNETNESPSPENESKFNISNLKDSAEICEYVEDRDDEYKDPDYDPREDSY